MKYHSTDHLQDFEFHDSEFTLLAIDDSTLAVSARKLNIHKDTPQNDSDFDMEIDIAKITFHGFQSLSYEPGRSWHRDENGNAYTDDPLVIFTGHEAINALTAEMQNTLTVYHLVQEEGNVCELGGCGDSPYFTIRFAFDFITIEWDAYRKKAWYEQHRQYKKQLTLSTASGDQNHELYIICHDEEVYVKKSADQKPVLEKPPIVSVGLKYGDQEIWGSGKDLLWMDAFADLQNKLPEGVTIKCCMTCQYGNMCPVGTQPGELFCTKDVVITQKSDLYFYTEDNTEVQKRSRDSTYVCNDYKHQAEDFYTYNDYLYWLKKKATPAE